MWDSQENIERVCENVKFLTLKGCSCKGNCSTCRCKCSKQHKNCGANYKCSDCENLHKDGKCKWNCPDIHVHVTNNENIVEISQTVKLNDLNDTDNESDIETSDVDIDAQYDNMNQNMKKMKKITLMAAMILKFLTKLIQKMKLGSPYICDS